ncbi:hydrogenase maturation protease [Leptolyngbya cf. ectocarpi LEGE 11479]|uniref:Hydrogenase maturation protease n=1 Tax=Leptolyngbya cf. ectocarpi LEGE 11479 TaxID=1828722 RepID=A0A928ZYJ8_LEPEC|nr:hydrogenase maturation protease [Leptolyngbya ectocarpi]MBE9069874.1 hydrogenase maturation protease [Leptolyngbya cf. ectocarpi LEGE 11479]
MAYSIDGFSSEASPTFVVIGYGNPDKGDDAIGQKVVAQLQKFKTPGLEAYSVTQLTPELSSKLAKASVTIFVDACKFKNTDTVQVKPLDACGTETTGSTLPGFGHSCSPRSLLALTQSVYGRFPKAWWVEVPANDFTIGHPLSAQAEQGVIQALQTIASLMSSAD